jgi:hypothetical protein
MSEKTWGRYLYGGTLEQFILAVHGVDVIWKPSESGEEPPF